MLVVSSAAVGLPLWWMNRHNAASLLLLPLMFGAFVYVVARVPESASPLPIKFVKVILSVAALVFGCMIAWWQVSLFDYASAYGWRSNQALGHPLCLALGTVLALMALTGVIEFAVRKWRKRIK